MPERVGSSAGLAGVLLLCINDIRVGGRGEREGREGRNEEASREMLIGSSLSSCELRRSFCGQPCSQEQTASHLHVVVVIFLIALYGV